MNSKEKDEVMESFKDGDLDILISTTVIEVGVNVPNANIMTVYNSERFGLAQLHQLRGEVARSAASQPSELRDRLEARLNELLGQSTEDVTLDPARLAQEAAILADKADVTEELLRLASHLQQLHDLLGSESSEGRRMDFVLQEVNREINTIQSKSRDQDIDKLTIEMKALTEQIREQVQNIE